MRAFEQHVYRYGDRHRVKSGLTGWAQVQGLRGQTSLSDRVEWDNYYIENWSLLARPEDHRDDDPGAARTFVGRIVAAVQATTIHPPMSIAVRPEAPAHASPGALAAPLGWRVALGAVALLLTLLAVTNRWMDWAAGRRYQHAFDEDSYLVIARAVPDLPSRLLPDQHAQRWSLHWLVGAVAQVSGLSVETCYRVGAIALAIAICLVLAALLVRLGVSRITGVLCLAVLILNPYAFRFYVFAPGYLADLAFVLALGTALLGIVRRSFPLLAVGVLVGVLARQTMLPVVPVLAVWVALDPRWRVGDRDGDRPPGRAALLRALALAALAFAAYAVVLLVAADFSQPGASLKHLTILYALEHLGDFGSDLAVHAARTAVAVLPVAALLAATLWRTGLRRHSATFWGALAVGATIVAQTLLLSPDPYRDDYGSSNEPRLAVLGLVPLVVALAVARIEPGRSRVVRGAPLPAACALAALLLIGTLHHQYTVVSTGSTNGTTAVQLLVAALLLAVLAASDGRDLRYAEPGSGDERTSGVTSI